MPVQLRTRGFSHVEQMSRARSRASGMASMRDAGYTLREIGERYGVSHQRVSGVLRRFGYERMKPLFWEV